MVSEKPVFYEHWVPTTLLIDLVYLYKWQNISGRENTVKYAETIAEIIRDTSAGQFEFFERVIHEDDEVYAELSKMVSEILAKEGIIYKLED